MSESNYHPATCPNCAAGSSYIHALGEADWLCENCGVCFDHDGFDVSENYPITDFE